MKYRNINKTELKPGTKIWACAYDFDKSKTSHSLIQKPVYGMIRGYGWRYQDFLNVTEETSYGTYFVPFKKNSKTELATSKEVRIESRVYADTYEECVELYNELVKERVEWFLRRASEVERDYIHD